MGNGLKPGGSADKSLGEIVSDVTSKLQLLVREEIELAKAEIADKAAKLGKGAGFVVGALITLLFFAIFLFHGLSWVINDLLDAEDPWPGFLIIAGFFLLLTALLAWLGLRSIKKGAPPTPDLAIEEAKKTRAVLEEARS